MDQAKRGRMALCVLLILALTIAVAGCGGGGGGGGVRSGATVTGRVMAPNATPVANATVTVGSTTAHTGADGRFTMQDVPTIMGLGAVAAFGYLPKTFTMSLTDGATVDVGSITLAADPSVKGTVKGKVVVRIDGVDVPIGGADVSAGAVHGTTAADGSFTLKNVASGTASGTVEATACVDKTFVIAFGGNGAADVGTITMSLDPAVSGTVKGKAQADTNGIITPAANVTVTAGSVSIQTGADGKFTLAGVNIRIPSIRLTSTGYASKNVTISLTQAGATVDVGTITLVAIQCTVTGEVRRSGSNAIVAGATVVLGPTADSLVFSATTNASGVFTATVPASVDHIKVNSLKGSYNGGYKVLHTALAPGANNIGTILVYPVSTPPPPPPADW